MSETPNNVQGSEPTLLPAIQDEDTAKMLAALDASMGSIRTNLPIAEGWAKTWLVKSSGDPDFKLETIVGTAFNLAYYHAKVVPVTLQDGQLESRVRVTLYDTEGKTLSWTSRITTQKFGEILQAFGLGPWDPPVKLDVIRKPAKGGVGSFYIFGAPVVPRPATAKKKGA
jgi:hypothetical protein